MKESELKSAVEEYLQYQQNLGKLVFLRLNAGEFIEIRGGSRRRIKGCPKGTADLLVLQDGQAIFFELKGEYGRQSLEQKEFEQLCWQHQQGYYIVRSVDEVMEVLG